MVIKEIIERGKGVKTFRLKRKDGENPAYFRAGQYISLRLSLDGSVFTRPYSLSSSPKDALNGFYDITIKANEDGFYSKWAVEKPEKGRPNRMFGSRRNILLRKAEGLRRRGRHMRRKRHNPLYIHGKSHSRGRRGL